MLRLVAAQPGSLPVSSAEVLSSQISSLGSCNKVKERPVKVKVIKSDNRQPASLASGSVQLPHPQESPRNGDALLLTAAELEAALPHEGVIPVRHPVDGLNASQFTVRCRRILPRHGERQGTWRVR